MQKGLVNRRSTFVAHVETPKAVQPGERAFNDPACATEAAAVRCPALGELAADAAVAEAVAVGLRIVAAVPLDEIGFPRGAAWSAAEGWDGVDQREQLRHVMAIGGRQDRDERNPLRVGENVVLTPCLAAIGGVRSSFFPPRNARSDALSTTARARSIWPRRCSSVSNTAWSRFQTPARCQRTRRRQQGVPDPHPISCGNMFQGSPLRSTKRIPVKTARSGMGFRPACWRFRARRFGSSGSIKAHRSSSIANVAMRDGLLRRHATVPRPCKTYKS